MTRKVGDGLVRTVPGVIFRGDLRAGGLPAAIPGTDGDFRSLDGIVAGMRGDLRRCDGFAAQRPMSAPIDAVNQAWTAFHRERNLRSENAVESGTDARRIGRTNASPEAPPPIRARRRRSTSKKEDGSWVG